MKALMTIATTSVIASKKATNARPFSPAKRAATPKVQAMKRTPEKGKHLCNIFEKNEKNNKSNL